MIMDTYKAVEKLVSIGVKKEHAVALTEIINEQNSDLATKSDIALVKKDIDLVKKDIERLEEKMATKSDMANLRSELKDDIAHFKSDIIKWIVGAQMSTLAIVITIVAFLK